MNKKISIIGAGTYGSYLANCISEKYPNAEIHLFEVGDSTIQSEKEIGFVSHIKTGLYKATSEGRYFGLGGTSAKWGGQLLFFSPKDFADTAGMKSVIECNEKYKQVVLGRFFKKAPQIEEKDFGDGMFIKKGVWLKFSQRNLFTHFQLNSKSNITIHTHSRIISLKTANGKVTAMTVLNKANEEELFESDVFYVTAGAFESLRLLDVSKILDMKQQSAEFSDHVSLRCFEILSSDPKVGKQDFQFRFENGSMITSRLIGEIDNTSFYVHPIFNEKFIFFQFLKQLIFKGKFSTDKLFSTFSQLFALFPFVFSYLFKKKLYIYQSWFLNIDIELANSTNLVTESAEVDRFNQCGIDVNYAVSEKTIQNLRIIKDKVAAILSKEGVVFRELEDLKASTLKIEDTYHPYRLFINKTNNDILDIYNPLENLYLFNTGLLYRSGGINPTASLFCLIEHHVENVLK